MVSTLSKVIFRDGQFGCWYNMAQLISYLSVTFFQKTFFQTPKGARTLFTSICLLHFARISCLTLLCFFPYIAHLFFSPKMHNLQNRFLSPIGIYQFPLHLFCSARCLLDICYGKQQYLYVINLHILLLTCFALLEMQPLFKVGRKL